MTIPYTPTTDEGTGFLPPLFKAAQHLHNVITATGHAWPITAEQARAELDHALAHMATMNGGLDMMSTPMQGHVKDWLKQLTSLRAELQKLEAANPETQITGDTHAALRDTLKELATQTWAMLSLMDQDILGYAPEATDAGRKP